MRYVTSPAALAKIRLRCAEIRSELEALDWEQVRRCNLCRADEQVILGRTDRYGLAARAALCPNCGLVYLVDRFSEEAYGVFYERWYRKLIEAHKGRPTDLSVLKRGQARYASALTDVLAGYLDFGPRFSILDLGGSTGVVAEAFLRRFDCEATVVDPAPEEIAEARNRGLEAHVGTVERWEADAKYDLVLLCQTIDHLFDLRRSLERIRSLMTPNGLFYCDAVDLMNICSRSGPLDVVFKVDHCYYFLHEMMPGMFNALGFEVVAVHHETVKKNHVGYLLRPAKAKALEPAPRDVLQRHLRRFHDIKTEWEAQGRTPQGLVDSTRRRLYRLKKRLGF